LLVEGLGKEGVDLFSEGADAAGALRAKKQADVGF
jgi:hypothetical protein